MMDLNDIRDDYDWREAFTVAECSMDFVGEILAISPGENDEENWIILFKATDGRFVFLTAWCDFTGWDCQSGGDHYVNTDLRALVLGSMGDEDRRRLGFDNEGNQQKAVKP